MASLRYRNIRKRVKELAGQINAPKNLLPTYGYSIDGAHPHIEIGKNGLLHYVVIERGHEFKRRTTDNLDELLYWIFSGVTFTMAGKFELENRIENKDFRRILFKKQEELLSILNESWGQKEHEEHLQILKSHPFDDLAGPRVTYWKELRGKGYSETEIEKLAYEKFPRELKQNFES